MDSLAPLDRVRDKLQVDNFDLILTNPPLGSYESRKEILDLYKLGRGKEKQLVHVLSIERCLELLKDKGRLAMIISEDVLERDYETIDFIKKNANILGIISLPLKAFNPYGANSKTNILVLEKSNTKRDFVFMAEALEVGYDTSGNPIDENDLIEIVRLYKSRKISDEEVFSIKPLAFAVSQDKLGDRIDVKHVYLNFIQGKKAEIIEQWKKRGYEIKKLSELVRLSRNTFRTDPNEKYLFVSVHFDGSISPRNRNWKKEKTKYKELVKLNKGDIIFSRINLIDGAVAVVPKELDGAVCSKEFIVLKSNEVNPYYLWIILRADYIKAFVKGKMTGVTGRHRIKWDDIKDIEIPIPKSDNELYHELNNYSKYRELARDCLNTATQKILDIGKIE